MKKKLIIFFVILLSVICCCIILSFTVFKIKNIEVSFKTNSTMIWQEDEIIKSANFNLNNSIIFSGKVQQVQNIEESFPYLEVINIETKFPNKYVIHVQERKAMFAVADGAKTLYLADDLKLLEVKEEAFLSTKSNAIFLQGLSFESDYKVGQVLNTKDCEIKQFYSAMLENNKSFDQIVGFCKSIKILSCKDDFNQLDNYLEIETFSGRKIELHNYNKNLSLKLSKMFFTLPKMIEILKDEGLSDEDICRAELVINNYVGDEMDVYTHIYLDGQLV